MPFFDYKCAICGLTDEFLVSTTVSGANEPTECKSCNNSNCMEKQFSSSSRIGVDVVGGYDYEYGKKAWKKNKSPSDQANIIAGYQNPY